MSAIEKGDLVAIHYTTRSLEGGVLETSTNREPLKFRAGSNDIIRGLSTGVIGMNLGESQTLSISPEHAFGRHQPDLIQNGNTYQLPEGAAVGDQMHAVINNVVLDVWIQRQNQTDVQIDANHPLAGETLMIDVEIVDHAPGESST